jgi:hypothetical protein
MASMEPDLPPPLTLPPRGEQTDAVALGVPRLELLAAEYSVQDGVLVERGPHLRAYLPALKPQLATDLAKVRDGDGEDAVRFARNWGLLGYRRMVLRARELAPERRDELLAHSPGDPLPWVWAHARGVRICLELLDYLQLEDDGGLEHYIGPLQNMSITFGNRYTTAVVGHWGDDDAQQIARWFVSDIVTSNLAGFRLELTTDFAITQRFDALCDVVYWHLAALANRSVDREVRRALRRCDECGAFYTRTDPRQRFCPPAPAEPGNESRCAKKARARRLRTRKETAAP